MHWCIGAKATSAIQNTGTGGSAVMRFSQALLVRRDSSKSIRAQRWHLFSSFGLGSVLLVEAMEQAARREMEDRALLQPLHGKNTIS
jgi:hypothetical protein